MVGSAASHPRTVDSRRLQTNHHQRPDPTRAHSTHRAPVEPENGSRKVWGVQPSHRFRGTTLGWGGAFPRTLLWGPLCHNTTRDMCDAWNQSDVPKNTAEPHGQTSTPGRKAVTFIPHARVRGWAWKTRLSTKRGGISQVAGSLTMVLTGSVSQHSTIR